VAPLLEYSPCSHPLGIAQVHPLQVRAQPPGPPRGASVEGFTFPPLVYPGCALQVRAWSPGPLVASLRGIALSPELSAACQKPELIMQVGWQAEGEGQEVRVSE